MSVPCTNEEGMLLLDILQEELQKKSRHTVIIKSMIKLYKNDRNNYAEAVIEMMQKYHFGTFFKYSHHALRVMRESFDKLPLHVNQKSPEARAVFKWRMEIGR